MEYNPPLVGFRRVVDPAQARPEGGAVDPKTLPKPSRWLGVVTRVSSEGRPPLNPEEREEGVGTGEWGGAVRRCKGREVEHTEYIAS